MRTMAFVVTFIVCLAGPAARTVWSQESPLRSLAKVALGKKLFFDARLSINSNQSCATCHDPETGFTGPEAELNAQGAVYEGSVHGRFGNRKPPSSAYATLSPILHVEVDNGEALVVGGNFWDGRATGELLGNPAADQAQGPFLNAVEQALGSSDDVVRLVCSGPYAPLFKLVWGVSSCRPQHSEAAYDFIALSIAAFEDSLWSNRFTSKFDWAQRGLARLSAEERHGLELFEGKANCARCHVLDGERPVFTDFTFDNIGVPRNPDNPWYRMSEFNPEGEAWVDRGLGGFLRTREDLAYLADENIGKQKVPTLRNVDRRPAPGFVKAYMHNGYFKSLKSVVHFYNTRDVLPVCPDPFTRESDALAQGCWPEPEISENVNRDEVGDLGLTESEEDALVAFMQTLSDGYRPAP